MKIIRKTYKILICGVIIISVFSVTVFAKYFTSLDQKINKFGVGSIDAKIAEKFETPDSFNGEKINKNVKVENTGKNDELVRVSIIPRWVDKNGDPWPGNTNLLTLNLENTINLSDLNDNNNLWIYGNDGYYYYSSKLPHATDKEISKEISEKITPEERYNNSLLKNSDGTLKDNYTKEFLSSVKLNTEKMSNEELARYKDKKLIIDVKVEAIEPRKEVIDENWNGIDSKLKDYLMGICN